LLDGPSLDRRADHGRPDTADYLSSFVPGAEEFQIRGYIRGLGGEGWRLTNPFRTARMPNAISICEIIVQRKN
jgi:hypothetical protein